MRHRSPLNGLPYSVTALWPAPAQVTVRRRPRHGETGYFVVPSVAKARLLVPIGVPGADRMLVRHAGGPLRQAARWTWRRALRSGTLARFPVRRLCVRRDPNGIEHHLAGHLTPDISLGLLLGPPRPNAKPVLQVFDAAGETVAFAKVGVTPLTADLLAREASALHLLGRERRRTFEAPQVISSDSWRQLPVLLQQALPLAQSGRAPHEPPLEVMAEIAGLDGITTRRLGPSLVAEPLSAAGSWFGLDLTPFELVRQRLMGVDCPIGSWHGDLGPWNMATDGSTTQVWDWERFEPEVPVGLDAAHFRVQVALAACQDPAVSWPVVTRDVAQVLGACGQDQRHTVIASSAYLVSVCRRYVRDAVDGPTPALRRRMTWLADLAAVAANALDKGTP